MPCNLKSPKARDPRFYCNERTNRWNLTSIAAPRAPVPVAAVSHNNDHHDLLSPIPLTRLRSFATKHSIKGRSTRDRHVLEGLIVEYLKTHPSVMLTYPRGPRVYGSMFTPGGVIPQTTSSSSWWKTRCENEGTLQGQEWKDLRPNDVVSFGKYCFTLPEIFSILHTEFTATDTSYQVPPLRLQVPRDPYTRQPFTLEFMKQVRNKLTLTTMPEYPEVLYFFHHLLDFYKLPVVKEVMENKNVSKASMSMAISNFLTQASRPDRLELDRRSRDIITWRFSTYNYQYTFVYMVDDIACRRKLLRYVKGHYY